MKLSTCTRHPGHRFAVTCPGCAQDCHDAQYGNPTNQGGVHSQRLAARVRTALGVHVADEVRPEEGETPIRRLVWSVRELDAIFTRHGGTVSVRQVEQHFEVKVTATLPGIAWEVEVFTDWDPADEPHGFALLVVQSAMAKV